MRSDREFRLDGNKETLLTRFLSQTQRSDHPVRPMQGEQQGRRPRGSQAIAIQVPRSTEDRASEIGNLVLFTIISLIIVSLPFHRSSPRSGVSPTSTRRSTLLSRLRSDASPTVLTSNTSSPRVLLLPTSETRSVLCRVSPCDKLVVNRISPPGRVIRSS